MGQFFTSRPRCRGCNGRVEQDRADKVLCRQCNAEPKIRIKLEEEMAAELRSTEQAYADIYQTCMECQDHDDRAVELCTARNCTVFYRRIAAKQKVGKVRAKQAFSW